MGKSSAPAAPNYAAAAQQTAQGNLEAARAAAAANRVNQVTPYGSLTYSHTGNDPDNGWTATQNLSPEQQAMLDKNNRLSSGLLDTAGTGLGYVNKALANGGALDESRLAQAPISGQSVQDAIMSRLQPQLNRNMDSLRTRLANQGVSEGSDAYKNAMTDEQQSQNDLYSQAALQGINTGMAARQQGIQEQYAAQDRPLNIVNSLRTGTQVQNPNFVNVPQQATTGGADLLGAAQSRGDYNASAYGAQQAQIGNLLGAGATVGSAYFM